MRGRRKSQEGYALLLVIFLVVALTLSVSLATPNLLTQQRREKEEEMIWRGRQYARAVNLFYRKQGHFPATVEDLCGQRVGIRFLRHAYKDPMNTSDGSWRLIYVGPDGRIIGSLREKHDANLFMAPPAQGWQGPLASNSSSATASSSSNPSSPTIPATGTTGGTQNATNSSQGTPSSPTVPQNPQDSSSSSASSTQTAQSDDNGLPKTNLIIGVGSKIDKKSIRLLDREKNYLQFEFIWNPNDRQTVVVH